MGNRSVAREHGMDNGSGVLRMEIGIGNGVKRERGSHAEEEDHTATNGFGFSFG